MMRVAGGCMIHLLGCVMASHACGCHHISRQYP
jgi:hypothetical protein